MHKPQGWVFSLYIEEIDLENKFLYLYMLLKWDNPCILLSYWFWEWGPSQKGYFPSNDEPDDEFLLVSPLKTDFEFHLAFVTLANFSSNFSLKILFF